MADTRMYPVGSGFPKSRYYSTPLGPVNPSLVEIGVVKNQRTRVTAAQVNAGFVLLPAIPSIKWRIVDATFIAYGGAAATATSVDLLGTKAGSASRPLVTAVAAMGQSVVAKMGGTNSVVLTDGASYTAHDANTAISVTKQSGGSSLGTATGIDVNLTFVAESA